VIFKKINTDNYDLQKVQDSVAASLTDVDKKVRGISNEYDLVMPRYAPASKLPLQMDSEGNVTAEALSVAAFIAPTIQKFTSGSGTYTTPANVKWIRVRMIGGGGGGSGSGTAGATSGVAGGATTFGSSLLTANGGGKGAFQGASETGGTATIASPAYGTAINGGSGGGHSFQSINTLNMFGGFGGVSALGGAAGAPSQGSGGGAGQANSGSGGAGGSGSATVSLYIGSGGSAGGFIDAIIPSPSSTYPYAVGAGGNGGSAGTSGTAGGAGGSGYIEVTEYYQ
jgi:hypothetical protein